MFDRVTIIGVGLLGASLGLALKERGLARRVVGVGRRNSPSLDTALARHAIDEAFHEVALAAKDSDLVVLCTPIRQFPAFLKQLACILPPSAIITDVGSTKAQVMQWAREILPPSAPPPGSPIFIGSHPMAGSEKRGPGHARADLYENSLCFLCTPTGFEKTQVPVSGGQDRVLLALEKIQTLWRNLGMRTLWLPAEEHDRWVAVISHLPHAVAFTLVTAAAREPQMLQAVANGFIDTTRVASSDIDMWTDIFLTNGQAVAAAIDTFSADLAALKEAIRTGNEPAIRARLSAAKKTRDDLVEHRKSVFPSRAGNTRGDPE